MNENEAYMIPECNAYRTKTFSQVLACDWPSMGNGLCEEVRKGMGEQAKFDSVHQLELKMVHARERIAARIENEGNLICAELKRLRQDISPAAKNIIKEMLARRIDALWLANAADYVTLCTLSYLSSVPEDSNHNTKSFEAVKNALQVGLKEMIRSSIEQFSKQRQAFKERVAAVIDAWDEGPIALAEQVWRLFTFHRFGLGDSVHRAKIQAKLIGIKLTGRAKYTYMCEHSKTTCSQCQALSGQNFFTSEAQEGENLPPLHPHCRCTIQGYPALSEDITTTEVLKLISEGVLQMAIDAALTPMSETLGEKADDIGDDWSILFEDAIKEYYGTFDTIKINGVEYYINRNNFTAVAIGPDGELIVPENAKPYDKHMLELMKKRDELPEDSEERAEVQAEIDRLDEENKQNNKELLSVDSEEAYNFYILGEDVTDRLNEYMRQTEVNYAHMHNRPWVENLIDFYLLVRGGGEMDLKNQPEWEHSAYIYNGELVSQDALGNINYGYFGTFCNIPQMVLIVAGGVAQSVSHRKVNLEFWYTVTDDPRDTFRVLQGIDIYDLWH